MSDSNQQRPDQPWESAVSSRLSKLRTMPIDTSRLDQMIRAQIPQPVPAHRIMWLRSARAIAASLLILGGITAAVLFSLSGGNVAAADMAQVHREIVSGQVPVMQVQSIEEANRMLAEAAPGAPPLPQVPRQHVMACCMTSVHNKKMACVLLKDEGVPITMAVANASDMKLPHAPTTDRDGVSYRVQSSHGLNMVMTERNRRWLCLISEMPADRLMDVAAQLRF